MSLLHKVYYERIKKIVQLIKLFAPTSIENDWSRTTLFAPSDPDACRRQTLNPRSSKDLTFSGPQETDTFLGRACVAGDGRHRVGRGPSKYLCPAIVKVGVGHSLHKSKGENTVFGTRYPSSGSPFTIVAEPRVRVRPSSLFDTWRVL